MRKFERISTYPNAILPRRATIASAGYDLAAAETVEVLPGQYVLIPTGIRAIMAGNEFLQVSLRSSLPGKKHLLIPNGVGVIDADYQFAENEGHIHVGVCNFGSDMVTIKEGERIAQGIFCTYATTIDDDATGTRIGGFGSTGN